MSLYEEIKVTPNKTLINMVRRKEKEIYKAKIAYYTTDRPIMSDYLYDRLEDSFKATLS